MSDNDGVFKINDSKMNCTISSNNTISEMKIGKNPFFKLFYISATIINSILGLNLIMKFYDVMIESKNLNFLLYLILYTFKWPIAFLFGIILSLFIITFKMIFSSEYSDENTPNYIGHVFVCFVYNLVFFYIGSVFWSIYLIVMLLSKDSDEYKVNFRENYQLIYIFLIINFIISFIIFSIFLYFLLIKTIPFRINTERDNIDEDFINKIKEEIIAVNKISGTFIANKENIYQNEILFKEFETNSIKNNKYGTRNDPFQNSKFDSNTKAEQTTSYSNRVKMKELKEMK